MDKRELISRDFQALTTQYTESTSEKLSVPIPDHYFPLLYVLGAANDDDNLTFIYEGIQNGSISMRTLSFA